LVVFNKWEGVGERRFDECLDRLGDLELQTAWVKSDRGKVPANLIFGIDGGLARTLEVQNGSEDHHDHSHDSADGHQSEVEVLSVTLSANTAGGVVDTTKLENLLRTAPKDEVYRIKAIMSASSPIKPSDEDVPQSVNEDVSGPRKYILNWAFGRWTSTLMAGTTIIREVQPTSTEVLRMTLILARYESTKWKKRLESGNFIDTIGTEKGILKVEKIA